MLIIMRVEEALSDKISRVYRTLVDVYCKLLGYYGCLLFNFFPNRKK